MENTEAWIDPKIVHLPFYNIKYQHSCTFDTYYILTLKLFQLEGKKSLLVFQQTCKTWIEQQSIGQLLCILTRSVMVPTVIVNIMFCTTAENCKPRITVYGMMCRKITNLCVPFLTFIDTKLALIPQNLDYNLPITVERPRLQDLFMTAWVSKPVCV